MANAIHSYVDIDLGMYENQKAYVVEKQGDDESRFLRITLIDNDGKEIDFAEGVGVTFAMKTSKGADFLYSTMDSGDKRVFVDNGKILVRFNQNMLADSGVAHAELILTSQGAAISSTKFEIFIEESVSKASAEATTEFRTLIDLLENAQIVTGDLDVLIKQVEAAEAIRQQNYEIITATNSAYMSECKSYAVGTGNVYRADDETDNAKYYSGKSSTSADESKSYADNSKEYRDTSEDWSIWSKSWAVGDTDKMHPTTIIDESTGTQQIVYLDDDVDNSKYYCGLAQSAKEVVLEAEKNIKVTEEQINKKVKATQFEVNFATGELEYNVTGGYEFEVDYASGCLMYDILV